MTPPAPTTQTLPRGRHGIDPTVVRQNQRDRILQAMIAQVAAAGWADTTVGHVVRHARVSRETFYECFAGKLEAYEAARREVGTAILQGVDARRDPDAAPLQQLRDALAHHLRTLADRPDVARCFLVERPEGHAMLPEERALFERGVELVMTTLGTDDRFACTAYVRLVRATVLEHVAEDRADELPALADPLVGLLGRMVG